MSSLTWLAYSEAERRRTLDVIHMLGEPLTVDSIGIGRIRDAISDTLFPGTSTIQTRARYFLIVPWVYRDLERRSPLADAADRARRAEHRLIEALLRGSDEAEADNSGVIGKYARQGLSTLPSSIYWQGLAKWGIRRYPGEIRSYHRLLAQVDLRHPAVDDDGEALPGALGPAWDPHLPPEPEGLYETATLELPRFEAAYLAERVTSSHPFSLLAEILAAGVDPAPAPYPWALPPEVRGLLSERNLERLDHAELFSLIVHGAALLYNHMLALEAGRAEREQEYRAELGNWAHEVEANRARFEPWAEELDSLWRLVNDLNPRAPGPLERRFVEDWIGLALRRHPAAVITDDQARELIADREYRLKRSNARLGNRSALEAWGGASGTGRLDFRWSLVKRLVGDIRDGLEGPADPLGVAEAAVA